MAEESQERFVQLDGVSNLMSTRRDFLKKGVVAGASAAALYVAPSFISVTAKRAYAGITGAECVSWWVTWIGDDAAGTKRSAPITPISTSLSAVEYFGYGTPDSMSANTPDGLEDNNADTALFFLLNDGNGNTNLGSIFDKPNTATGGQVTATYSGLPADISWAVVDDPGEVRSIDGSGGAEISSIWLACCTDGGMLSSPSGGLNCGSIKITITLTRLHEFDGGVVSAFKVYSANGIKTAVPSTFCIEAKPL